MSNLDLTKSSIPFDQLPEEIQRSVEENFGKRKIVYAAMITSSPLRWNDEEVFAIPSIDWDLSENNINMHFFGLKKALSYSLFGGPTVSIYRQTEDKSYMISEYLESREVSVIMIGESFMNDLDKKKVIKVYR